MKDLDPHFTSIATYDEYDTADGRHVIKCTYWCSVCGDIPDPCTHMTAEVACECPEGFCAIEMGCTGIGDGYRSTYCRKRSQADGEGKQ